MEAMHWGLAPLVLEDLLSPMKLPSLQKWHSIVAIVMLGLVVFESKVASCHFELDCSPGELDFVAHSLDIVYSDVGMLVFVDYGLGILQLDFLDFQSNYHLEMGGTALDNCRWMPHELPLLMPHLLLNFLPRANLGMLECHAP